MSERWDVVVVGAGHNGLVASFYLARAGLRTLVLERRELVGGACVTETFAPGFRASTGAYVLSMLRPAVWHDLRLAERGLRVLEAGPSLHLFPDGARLRLSADGAATVQEIGRFAPSDARAYPRFQAEVARVAGAIVPAFDLTPPDPRARRVRDLRGLARFGRLALRGRRLLQDAAYLFTTSAEQFLSEWFDSEHLKAALGWESISNTLDGPASQGTAYGLLHEAVSGGTGGGVGWGFVPGGMGEVTRLMAEAALEAGATIRTGTEVERVLIAGGRATGVLIAGGEEIGARAVASNADPKRTLLGLVGAEHLPADVVSKVRAYRCEGASMKITLAVSELPVVADEPNGGIRDHHRGLLQVTKPLDDLDLDQALAREGVPAPEPHVELCIPSVHDPSLAPEGAHVVTLGVRSQPYELAEGTWDEHRERVADRVIEHVGRFLPNLPGSVVHRQVLSPLDLERRFALTGGHHLHGDMSPDQLFFLRPIRGYGDYRTPIRHLYLCGAGTHPGGGVTGANGRNAAREILRDLERRRS
jgi:phytoene dehydrogenase-like protein